MKRVVVRSRGTRTRVVEFETEEALKRGDFIPFLGASSGTYVVEKVSSLENENWDFEIEVRTPSVGEIRGRRPKTALLTTLVVESATMSA